jgi:hypothetical protein
MRRYYIAACMPPWGAERRIRQDVNYLFHYSWVITRGFSVISINIGPRFKYRYVKWETLYFIGGVIGIWVIFPGIQQISWNFFEIWEFTWNKCLLLNLNLCITGNGNVLFDWVYPQNDTVFCRIISNGIVIGRNIQKFICLGVGDKFS